MNHLFIAIIMTPLKLFEIKVLGPAQESKEVMSDLCFHVKYDVSCAK